MSILVVCPGCHKRFQVSDQFAGRTGTCPTCSGPIRVPTKDEEVKVRAPEEVGRSGRGTGGMPAIEPIGRQETKASPVAAMGIAATVVVVVAATWAAGSVFQQFLWARAVALLALSPLVVLGGYAFLHDDENLEPYQGIKLYVRSGICAAAYVAIWGVFGYVAGVALGGEMWNWFLVAPPFFVMGALVALACLDLDFGGGFFLYCFYVLVTIALRWVAGMGWIWEIPK